MAKMKKKEIKIIFGILCAVFLIFLAAPMVQLLLKSFVKDGSIGAGNFREMFGQKGFFAGSWKQLSRILYQCAGDDAAGFYHGLRCPLYESGQEV